MIMDLVMTKIINNFHANVVWQIVLVIQFDLAQDGE